MPKTRKKQRQMPIRWQMLLEILPNHNWNITKAGRELGYTESYLEHLPVRLHKDKRFCQALSQKKAYLAKICNITKEGQSEKFERVGNEAETEGQHSAAVAAYKEQTRLFGLYDEDNKQKSAQNLAVALAVLIKEGE